jgi:hypothetical protein
MAETYISNKELSSISRVLSKCILFIVFVNEMTTIKIKMNIDQSNQG